MLFNYKIPRTKFMSLEARRDNKGEGKSCKMNIIKHSKNFLSVFGDHICEYLSQKGGWIFCVLLKSGRDITPLLLLCLHINICLGTNTYAKEMQRKEKQQVIQAQKHIVGDNTLLTNEKISKEESPSPAHRTEFFFVVAHGLWPFLASSFFCKYCDT